MATTKVQVPLYLRVWLTPKCHVELTISGELNTEAFERLAAFLGLTAEILKPEVEIAEKQQ